MRTLGDINGNAEWAAAVERGVGVLEQGADPRKAPALGGIVPLGDTHVRICVPDALPRKVATLAKIHGMTELEMYHAALSYGFKPSAEGLANGAVIQ